MKLLSKGKYSLAVLKVSMCSAQLRRLPAAAAAGTMSWAGLQPSGCAAAAAVQKC